MDLTAENTRKQGRLTILFLCLLLYGILFTLMSEMILPKIIKDSGLMLMVTALISFLPVGIYLWFYQAGRELTEVKERISINKFLFLFMAVLVSDLIIAQFKIPLEKLFGIAGLTAQNAETSGEPATAAYLFYVCIIGPVIEELIYRGAVLGRLKKHGTIFAIVVTAFLFGIMHHDFYQGISAFAGGIIYGYVANRYSVATSVMLHMANNSFAQLLPVLKSRGTTGASVILLIVFISLIVVSVTSVRCLVAVLRRKREQTVLKKDEIEAGADFAPLIKNPMFWAVMAFDCVSLIVYSFRFVG